jgi:hypothetical protein
MATDSKRPVMTYGALRKRLAKIGDPWRPDPTKSDDEPLPEFPTGGDGHYEPAEREIGKGGVNKLLRSAIPPSNPDLRAEWQEQGIVVEAEVDEPPTAKRSTRKKPAEVPAPNSGG